MPKRERGVTAEPGKTGLSGANNGTLHDIEGVPGRLKSVTIRSGEVIDSLALELLEKITGGFNEKNKIGSGGYGKVYKGVLDGKEIAVKKVHDHLALDDVIFKKEFENLMRVQHQNIVELIGYCNESRSICAEHNGITVHAEQVYRVLCFEYFQNGSLDKHLYEEHRGLDWCTRYKIIKGICEGLNYLHGLEKPILHLDLKPANILLDENMVPKIADFGLSRLLGGTHTHITKNPVGTTMYMPPECVNGGIITKKNDVFSLGVIIIQIMTGREGCSKYWEEYCDMSSEQFIELVHQNWKVRVEATSMHTSAGENCKQVKRCIEIALNCVKPDRRKRPTIGDIIHKLRETETMIHQVPMPFSQESGSASSSHFKTEMVQNWGQEKQRGGQVKDSSNQQHEVLQKHWAPRLLPLELLEKITGGFSKEHEIGSGGYGKVYKGVLNGKEIAVKKLFGYIALDDVIFKNEVEDLMRVRHQNIVELVGYCHEIRHRCVEYNGRTVYAEMVDRVLCFEYLQNGSLDKHLYEEHRGLDWCTRYKIIKGICEGLNYLHGLEKPILHLDLKPANILLDENMVPKIADFGLSRLFGTDITKNPVGTQVYMPPEYVNEGIITKKYDVFSLGVIIIQIMTGREGCSKYGDMSSQQFIELVHQNWKVRVEATSMHTSAGEDCKQVKRCIEIALKCVETEREKRPMMWDIIHKLRETETVTHEVPMPFSQESGSASSSHFKTENWSQEKQRGGEVKDSSNQQREVLQKQSGMQLKDSSNEPPGSLEKEYQEDTKKRAASGIYEVSMPFSQESESVSRQFERAMAHDEKEVRSELEAMKEERGGGGGMQEQSRSVGGRIEMEVVHGEKKLWSNKLETIKEERGGKQEIGPWGGSAGRAHSIKVAPHRLESVTIWSADIIDAFAFSYSDHNGSKHTIGPFGGPGGRVYRIKFAPSEFLLEVSGTIGPYAWAVADVVQTLTLVTNAGSYGPFGQVGGGTPFHTSIQSNDRIVSFFGRGGMFVHAIGVYVRHIERKMVHGGKEVIFGLDEEALAKIGPWGGNGGMAYDMKVAPHRLESLTICCGVVIDSLSFSYDDHNGKQHTVGPWGGPGENTYTIPLGPFEFLTGVSGTVGSFGTIPNVITSLMFTTNSGHSYGPFGQGGGTPFRIPVENNGCIVGFFGHAGSCVEALGVYIRTY